MKRLTKKEISKLGFIDKNKNQIAFFMWYFDNVKRRSYMGVDFYVKEKNIEKIMTKRIEKESYYGSFYLYTSIDVQGYIAYEAEDTYTINRHICFVQNGVVYEVMNEKIQKAYEKTSADMLLRYRAEISKIESSGYISLKDYKEQGGKIKKYGRH